LMRGRSWRHRGRPILEIDGSNHRPILQRRWIAERD
jgi:hypothetical protein